MLKRPQFKWLDLRNFKQHAGQSFLHTVISRGMRLVSHPHPCPPTAGLDFFAASPGPFAVSPAYTFHLAPQLLEESDSLVGQAVALTQFHPLGAWDMAPL
mmetsp:Transcript_34262/g.42181  ORF Transcript_34262/g.42181 Transcript_34262/m.42181 type:complete len:100 (-) Transcript_34262:119-418(-)